MMYKNALQTLWSRLGWKTGLLLVAGLAVVAFMAPNQLHIGKADTVCTPTFTTPRFNAYPVSYNHPNGEPCTEFPALQGRLASGGQFPRSQSQWAAGTTASAGQEVLLQSWIHNSAAPGSGKLFNVKVQVTVDSNVGSTHTVSVRFTADNAAPFTSSYTIHTGPNDRIVPVDGSGYIYDNQGNTISSGFDIGTVDLGDMKACFEFAHFISFKVRVVSEVTQPPVGCIDIIKETYNTQGTEITPVTQFSFKLDNNFTVVNDSTGRARFVNVVPGTHTVTETIPSGWVQASVAPVGGVVQVTPGTNCAVVTFKNRQNITPYGTPYGTPYASPYATPYQTPYGTPYNTPYATPYQTPYGTPYSTPYATPYQTPYATPAQYGCITIIKEAFNTNGSLITPVPQFTFKLDNNRTAVNDGTGRVTFTNVAIGQHTVTETVPAYWTLLSVAPEGGRVTVTAGTNCAVVLFKNKQVVQYATPYGTPYQTPYQTPYSTPVYPNLVFSKKAWNDTQNKDATTVPANREDYVTYTLTVTNTGTAESKNFVITDDLSGVLPFADVTNNGGGTVTGNTISYPAVNIAAGQSVSKTFQVRIKFHLAAHQSFLLTNTYGNTINITVPGKTIYVAPKTGSDAMSMGLFAGLVTAGYIAFRKRKNLMNFIWA